jgi:hypothetical protein
MYEITVGHISSRQFNNLLKGKGVRVSPGNIHTFTVDKKLYNKFNRPSSRGKKITLKTGAGLLTDVYNYIKANPMLRRLANRAIYAGKKYAHRGTDYLASKVHSKIDEFPMFEGSGMKRGRGLAGMALSGGGELANLIGGPGSSEASAVLKTLGGVANVFGFGMKPRRRVGKGFFGDMAKNIAKSAAQGLVDTAAGYAKDKISGMGMKRPRKRASAAQLAALAKGRAIRDANRGYGGSGLRPAGY